MYLNHFAGEHIAHFHPTINWAITWKKNFIWVSRHFARKYYYFYVSIWKRDRHFTWSSEPREGLAACTAKGLPSFLSYFKTLSIGPAPEIEPATSRSAVKYEGWSPPIFCFKFHYDEPAISGSIIRTEIRPTEQKLRSRNRNWTNRTEITKLEPKLNQQNRN